MKPERDRLLLSVRHLVVRHRGSGAQRAGVAAVRDVSLEIAPGRILALVGESGSGKTSLARAVLRLLPIESGEVWFLGQDLAVMNSRELRGTRRRIQAIFQDPLASLSPRRTVLQALLEPMNHFAIGPTADRRERAAAALETVGLEAALLGRYPHELSGGERQRVSLARALVSEPDLIVADEPLSSLDVSVRSRIVDLIRDLRDRLGVAFLLVSHDLSLVRRLADEVAVMYSGELVESGPAAALFARAAHPYTRGLLSCIPVPDPAHPKPVAADGEGTFALTARTGCVFHMRCGDRMDRCAAHSPGATRVAGSDVNHLVRCHLWNR